MGENGSGKSTLLEAIAVGCGFNTDGGTKISPSPPLLPTWSWIAISVSRGEYDTRGTDFLYGWRALYVATNIDELDQDAPFGARLIDSYGGKSLHQQLHGESFLALVENRFGGEGLYLLGELEMALSPARQLVLLTQIKALLERRSQFIIVTYSRILMAYSGADIY